MRNLIAILPEEVKGKGICSRVYTTTEIYIDHRTPTLLLDTMYKDEGKSKKYMDRKITALTQSKKNIPYLINIHTVMFGFKYREPLYDDQRRGFVNVKFVNRILNTEIELITGEIISTLNTRDTLIRNKNDALMLLYMENYLQLQETTTTNTYLTGRVIRRE